MSAPAEIFRGITYECIRLPETTEGCGAVHIVRVDLTAPGIELYLTPVDTEAVKQGFEYRLDFPKRVADRERVAVLINGTLFSSQSLSRWLPLPGDWSRGAETVVADHEINHVDANSYLLWFDEHFGSHLETTKPPAEDSLKKARWGISSQGVSLHDGAISQFAGQHSDRRTLMGIDSERHLLWLAVFEQASGHLACQTLAERGARSAILLDGGDSTSMVLGASSPTLKSKTVLGGYRPVANFFGIRAQPLPH